ncbi:Oxysterol-binding protein 4 [Tilletia horrida]|nr:Oxysterol-binding protein 4 [Tilletia horrida]
MRRALSAATGSRSSSKTTTPEPETGVPKIPDIDDENLGKAVPKEQKAGWAAFIKSIASCAGDLSSLTAPSFILSPVSLTDWCEHPQLFAKLKDAQTAPERLLDVTRWFISSLKGSYTARNASMGSEKKPLNPILGELFLGHWPATEQYGETQLVSEQVSHHPPITAFWINNAQAGVTFQGHCAQKTSFSGRSIQVRQIGHGKLTFRVPGTNELETYIITLPHLIIEGLLFGSPYVELAQASHIVSSSGYAAKIEYSGRGYFSGKAHSFKAVISDIADVAGARPIYTVDGSWTGESFIKGGSALSARGGSAAATSGQLFWNADTQRSELAVKPIAEQGDMESRRVWKLVAEGIRTGDADLASRNKSKIENEQRSKRKEEASAGRTHELKYFEHIEDDSDYAELTAMLNRKQKREETFRYKA